jgi:alpha-tubulin suppressor-like RCC1 family protein
VNIPTALIVDGQQMQSKYISCNGSHTILIDMNDNVWAFGHNVHGQLGLGDTIQRNTPTQLIGVKTKNISCGNNHTIVIDLNNNLLGFGNNEEGTLGLGENITNTDLISRSSN